MTRLLLALLLAGPAAAGLVRTAPVEAPAGPGMGAAGAAPGAGLAAAAPSLFASPQALTNGVLPSAVLPTPARALSAQVIAKVMAEDPAARAQLLDSFEHAPFRAGLGAVAQPEAYLAERLGEAFEPYFQTYAKEVGHADAESGLRHLLGDSESARETRQGLGRLLRNGSARSESWTYIFRDSALWQKSLEEYLDGRIAQKRAAGTRDLHIQSVGAAYGAEPYTLAMLTEDALKRAGEDPAAWKVRIDAGDLSLMSLISAKEGFYRNPEGGGYFIPKSAGLALRREAEAGRLLPAGSPELYRLRADLRAWIRPVYMDLNDVRQHRVLSEAQPDAVFANYILTHLRPGPAARLAEHFLSGAWSDHGFLAMAQTLVAEVSNLGGLAAKGRLGHEGSFLRRMALTVGAIGGAYSGESHEPYTRFRDFLFTNRSGPGRAARRAAARYVDAIRKDPFHSEALDPAAVAAFTRLQAETGVRLELTTSDSLAVGMTRGGAVAVSVGLLMPGADGRIELMERMVRELAPKAQPVGAPEAAAGTSLEGARLKIAGSSLVWLVRGRLAPITDHYVDEKPPAPPRPPGAPAHSGGISVRF